MTATNPDAAAAEGIDDAPYLDLRGLNCPLPVLKMRRRLMTVAPGGRLLVETTDPLAAIDIPAFCNEDGHRLLRNDALTSGNIFLVEKALK